MTKLKKSLCALLAIILIATAVPISASAVTGNDVVAYAKQFVGYRYAPNTHGPNSFDCSGFVYYVFKHFNITMSLSPDDYYRTPTKYGTVVGQGSIANAKPGDVIAWPGHTAIYSGNGYAVEALNPTKGVVNSEKVDSQYRTWKKDYKVLRVKGVQDVNFPNITLKVPWFCQRQPNDCAIAVVSMVEAYKKGYSTNDATVYNTVFNFNDKNKSLVSYAKLGYSTVSNTLQNIYNELKKGNPVIIRSVNPNHFCVVYAYTGNTATLQKSGFKVLNPYHYNTNDYRIFNNPNEQGQIGDITFEKWLQNHNWTETLIRAADKIPLAANGNPSQSYSTNTNSYFSGIRVNNISETDAQIYGTLPKLTYMTTAGFYFGTSESSLKKYDKNLAGKADGAGNFENIFYTLSGWYGKLKPGTKYYYKLYYISGGKEYASPVNWFITAGKAQTENPPPAPQLKVDKPTVAVGETATITWPSCGNNLIYWINIFKAGQKIYAGKPSGNLTHAFKPTQEGNYQINVCVETQSGVGTHSTIWVKCSNAEQNPPPAPQLNVDKANITLGETATISWPSCGSNVTYWINIFNGPNNVYGGRPNGNLSHSFKPTEAAYYKISVIVTDANGKSANSAIGIDCKKSVTLSSVSVSSLPKKTVYTVGETLDTSGLTLEAIYSDGTKKTVAGGYTCTPTLLSTEGTQNIDVNYEGKTTVFQVTVNKQTIENAKAVKMTATSAYSSAGGIAAVKIKITDNPGFSYLKLKVGYDSSVMSLTNVNNENTLNAAFQGSADFANNPYVLVWSGTDNSTAAGNIITLTFKINDKAKPGAYPVTLTADDCSDSNGDIVDVSTTNGKVTIGDTRFGDINNDGRIDGRDSTLLMKYLAEWDVSVNEKAADVNNDGKIDGRDSTLLMKYLAEWDVTLG